MKKRFALSLCAVSWLFAPGAQAFSTAETFRVPAAAGGGGERYFTGVPTDSYSCEVCHGSKDHVPLEITGLPLDGYEAGGVYFIEVTWPAGTPSIALAAEFATPSRVEQTTPALTPSRSFSAMTDEFCQVETDRVAMNAVEGIERNILWLDPCGSQVARFALTVPDEPQAYFGIGAVASNDSEDPDGDATFEYHVQLRRVGEPKVGSSDGCSATPRSTGTGLAWSVAMALGLLAWARRRAARLS